MAFSWISEKLRGGGSSGSVSSGSGSNVGHHAFQRYGAQHKAADRSSVEDAVMQEDSATKPRKQTTTGLVDFYKHANANFAYDPHRNPRRILTKPGVGMSNNNYDNADGDYILIVNDIIGAEEGHQYRILDMLGHGTFGQVVKCQHLASGQIVAVKVIKNKPAYLNQSMSEVKVLELLNRKYDPDDKHHIIRMMETMMFRQHLCFVFEVMSINLYELLKQNNFRGLSTSLVRNFVTQIMDCMLIMSQAKVIHCDLKPENILLKSMGSPTIKVIDFGSACQEHRTVYTYIQSRFYRAPEVLVGMAYTSAIDMWSLGCICAELFLGLPIFPGSSEYNQLSRIIELVGLPPANIIELGKYGRNYFNKKTDVYGQPYYEFKSLEQYNMEQNANEQPSKRYFEFMPLVDLVRKYQFRKSSISSDEREKEMEMRECLLDFLRGLLRTDPVTRWTAPQAARHPFITGEPYLGPYEPNNAMESRNRAMSSPMAPPVQQLSTSLLGTSPAIMTAVRRGPEFPAQGTRPPITMGGSNSLHPSSAALPGGTYGVPINIQGGRGAGGHDPQPDSTLGSTPASFESRLTASAWDRQMASASASQASLRSVASASSSSLAPSIASGSTGRGASGAPAGATSARTGGSPGSRRGTGASAAAGGLGAVGGGRPSGDRRRSSLDATSPPEVSPSTSPATDLQDNYYLAVGSAPSAGLGRPPASGAVGVKKPNTGAPGGAGAVPFGSVALGANTGLPPNPPPSFNQSYLAPGGLGLDDAVVGSAPSGSRIAGALGRGAGAGMANAAVAAAMAYASRPPAITVADVAAHDNPPSAAMDLRGASPVGGGDGGGGGGGAEWDPFYADDSDEMDLGPPAASTWTGAANPSGGGARKA